MRITPELWRAHEASKGFNRKIQIARAREFLEHMSWLAQSRILPTPGEFRPSENYLYLAALEARKGKADRERFLHYLGFDWSGENIAALDKRFQVTFNPDGRGPRREWWLEDSSGARQWLHEKIAEKPREQRRISYDPNKDKHGYVDPEIIDFFRVDAYDRVLPRRQAQVAYLYGWLHNEDRPSKTVGEIVRVLRENNIKISPAGVRWHLRAMAKNQKFRRTLGGMRSMAEEDEGFFDGKRKIS